MANRGDPQGVCQFPGIQNVISYSFSIAHGIGPSVCVLEITPQEELPDTDGRLSFFYGPMTFGFDDCHVDLHQLERTSNGFIWRVHIFDRRWHWRFPTISGRYNLPADGEPQSIQANTVASPHYLALKCLVTMRSENNADYADVPDAGNPLIDWDKDNAAESLAQIADSVGCRVMIGFDDKVKVAKLGGPVGGSADRTAISDSATINPPEKPDAIICWSAYQEYQVDLRLKAVGWETDNTIVEVDKLSYKPANGWGGTQDFTFFNDISDVKVRRLAAQSVYRWFQPVLPINIGIPGFDNIETLDRILPLGTTLAEVRRDQDGHWVRVPAFCYGIWANHKAEGANKDTKVRPVGKPPTLVTLDAAQLPVFTDPDPDDIGKMITSDPLVNSLVLSPNHNSFSIDPKQGLVKFSEPMIQLDVDNAGKFKPADLVLRTTIRVRTDRASQFERMLAEIEFLNVAGHNFQEFVREDIQPWTIISYDDEMNTIGPSMDNADFCRTTGKYYVDKISAQYDTDAARTITYVGLQKFELDGAIRQITWRGGVNQPATTTVSWNDERLDTHLSYAQRRQMERIRAGLPAPGALPSPKRDVAEMGLSMGGTR